MPKGYYKPVLSNVNTHNYTAYSLRNDINRGIYPSDYLYDREDNSSILKFEATELYVTSISEKRIDMMNKFKLNNNKAYSLDLQLKNSNKIRIYYSYEDYYISMNS